MAMLTSPRSGFVLILLLSVVSSARAADDTANVQRATSLIEEIANDPKSGIPLAELRSARGILIMPGIVETQVGVGRTKGRGVFLLRDDHGEWGDPEPVTISGLDAGPAAGRVSTDLVAIYRTRKATDHRVHPGFILTMGPKIQTQLRHKKTFRIEFSELYQDLFSFKDVLVFTRRHGLLLGAGITTRHLHGSSAPSADVKTPPSADRRHADAALPQGAPPAAAATQARTSPRTDSPETGRLKALLATMTTPPPDQIAKTATEDPKVRPVSGTTPAAGAAASPR